MTMEERIIQWGPRDLGENLQRDDDGEEHTITREEYDERREAA